VFDLREWLVCVKESGRDVLWCCGVKALGMGVSLHGCSVGQPGVGSSTGDFERWSKGSLGMEYLSLKRIERWSKGALGMEYLSLKRFERWSKGALDGVRAL